MAYAICVPIIKSSADEALKYAERVESRAVDCPLDYEILVEYRLDFMKASEIAKLFGNGAFDAFEFSTIATNRHRSEGGKFEGSEDERFAILQDAADYGADYIDIEFDHFRQINLNSSRLILSHHNFERIPDNLENKLKAMATTKAYALKFAVAAKNSDEAGRILFITDQYKERGIIGIGMGEAGRITRIFGPILTGSLWAYAPLDKEEASAPGQLTLDETMRYWERLKSAKPI